MRFFWSWPVQAAETVPKRTLLAVPAFHCYNARHRMADWKQITARIRRARTSKDPVAQLTNLYEKTQDAMVAFELARHFETAGQAADSGKWYIAAAGRFRRADWKVKALESAVRLGCEVPEGSLEAARAEDAAMLKKAPAKATAVGSQNVTDVFDKELAPPAFALTMPEPGLPFEQNAAVFESVVAVTSQVQSAAAGGESAPAGADAKRRRRGRRGGRNRRKSPVAAGSGEAPAASVAPASAPPRRESGRSAAGHSSARTSHVSSRRSASAADSAEMTGGATGAPTLSVRPPLPPLPVDAPSDFSAPSVKGRYGDPGLSSRLNLLEMQFRRLLTCEPAKLDDTVNAPVGPGVFLLSDSDLTSYYYVESCQTLRIAIANMLRGGTTKRGAESIKPQLAEHLGIPEARVGKYLADHCVVRWLQLDEGASHFAHFVISVLRPTLND
jgi:hypothetical protein